MTEKILDVLLVGAGGMGREWAKNLTACDEVRLVGWTDIRPGVATLAAADQRLESIDTSTDLQAAIEKLHPDFVVDVTSPEAHHDVTITALEAGLPVLGEKPMAESMARAREMVTASELTGRLYMVSQSRRYNANLAAFRHLIDQHIGPLGILNADFYIGAHFGGFRDEMQHPLLLDMAIHTFDAARYLSGEDPVAVYCEEFNPPWSWYHGNACATAIFEMTGGLHYTYRGSWCSDGRHTSWESEWRAVGPRGTATWDGHAPPIAESIVQSRGFHARTTTQTLEPDVSAPSGIAGSLRDFLRALRTGSIPMGECHDNLKSLAMVFGAIESARTGRRIALPV